MHFPQSAFVILGVLTLAHLVSPRHIRSAEVEPKSLVDQLGDKFPKSFDFPKDFPKFPSGIALPQLGPSNPKRVSETKVTIEDKKGPDGNSHSKVVHSVD
ncbi:unnamed protein product, partial [Mesocestoides corti]|uniref:Secreted protein n=1 Tax=Mesocestoides corti TaxID=53468 RepID=A0A0R3UP36_MESCO